MKIYNSYTKRKEEFIPLEGNRVKMYACGITVSGEAHIGHGYQALIYDIMRKYLKKQGYDQLLICFFHRESGILRRRYIHRHMPYLR